MVPSGETSKSFSLWWDVVSLLFFFFFIFIFRVRPYCISHHHRPSAALASSDVEFHVVARLDQVGKGAYSCDIYPSQPYCLPIAWELRVLRRTDAAAGWMPSTTVVSTSPSPLEGVPRTRLYLLVALVTSRLWCLQSCEISWAAPATPLVFSNRSLFTTDPSLLKQ